MVAYECALIAFDSLEVLKKKSKSRRAEAKKIGTRLRLT